MTAYFADGSMSDPFGSAFFWSNSEIYIVIISQNKW